ncbi:GIY-YIG nuclease family protein [bacterium]|nr:GIY-YIG nuclease family protein [bacterium]
MRGVYKILNCKNNKFYIGSSVDIERRFESHRKELIAGTHNNKHLQNAWNKYGESSFRFLVVEEVANINELRNRETYYLQSTNCTNPDVGYNLLNNANIGLGVCASKEVRQKISKACSGSKNGNYGRKHTKEELICMRNNRWGEGYECKPRKVYYHKKTPEELAISRKRMSDFIRNRPVSDETREKLRQSRLGKKASSELRKKFSDNRRGEKNANSKLGRQQVLEIYEKMNSGVNYKDVCAEYGIGQCLAYKIKRKEHWVFNDI